MKIIKKRALAGIELKKRHALITEKIKESALSVIPIIVIVMIMCLTFAPLRTDLMLSFLIGAVLIIVGMGLFALGAEASMTPIGTRIGTTLTNSRKLWLILFVSFMLGIAITVAEPDLQVLAQTVPHINSSVLIITVGIGVGFFLMICMLRIIMGIRLRTLLLVCYALVFALAAFTDANFLGVGFDSGGVTTGPMTVPFILALGIGVANVRSDKKAEADSFGLVALCSVGPILAVLLLGFFYKSDGANVITEFLSWNSTVEIGHSYLEAIPEYMMEMAVALSPILGIFVIFQLISFRMSLRNFVKVLTGIIYTYIGLVLFLTGVNVGFSSLGISLGGQLVNSIEVWLLVPIAMVLGWYIISAEPAVVVLQKQIEEVSSGAIPGKAVKLSLSIAIALAMGLTMIRVITEISILWFLVPGYLIALVLSFIVPDMFTAIAFDSGGVASGPMTSTFMLQFVIGVCAALGGNVLKDAFGLIAMVAMMPLISIQVMGVIYCHHKKKEAAVQKDVYNDTDVIELWG